MPTPQRSPRRSDALSRERIVATAIEILDADGEPDLTFRALTARLSTGAGAIYHHVDARTLQPKQNARTSPSHSGVSS